MYTFIQSYIQICCSDYSILSRKIKLIVHNSLWELLLIYIHPQPHLHCFFKAKNSFSYLSLLNFSIYQRFLNSLLPIDVTCSLKF